MTYYGCSTNEKRTVKIPDSVGTHSLQLGLFYCFWDAPPRRESFTRRSTKEP